MVKIVMKKILLFFIFFQNIIASELDTNIKMITIQNFEKEVLEASLPVFLNISVSWCPPCKYMDQLFQEAVLEFENRAIFAKHYIANPEEQEILRLLFEKYYLILTGFPVIIIFDKGNYKAFFQGCPKDKEGLIKTFNDFLENIGDENI